MFASVIFAIHPALVLGLLFVLAGGGALVWLVYGPGPRRGRGFKRAEQLLAEGKWQEARTLAATLRPDTPGAWQDRLATFEGKCLQTAANNAIGEGKYEEGLQHLYDASPLLKTDPNAMRERVVEAMLAHIRACFAATQDSTQARNLIGRVLTLQPASAEAFFWLGMCAARENALDQTLAALEKAHQTGNKQFIDPPFYLGVVMHRTGRPQDALRILAEANRVDPGCPFVAWQVGISLVATGGDSGMAVRVLQKALGPKGLPLWLTTPHRAWIEAFPHGKSFVRRFAEEHVYTCPLLGGDLKWLTRLAEQSLGQAYYRLGNFQEAADVYTKLLQDAAPTLPVLRGLGLSLTRLGKYDQAFKHLRAALEMEPNHGLTAGYLALCGAKGKPAQPEDHIKNVAWAVRQVSRFDAAGNSEYAAIMNAVHAEARALNLEIPREDQVRLCQALASVKASDAEAGAAFLHLARHHPDAVRAEHAWLFGRAAHSHGVVGEGELDLLARVFRDPAPARHFYAQQQWDLEDVEYLFLERFAAKHQGCFPPALGADYAPKGESLLLSRAAWSEEAKDVEGALRSVSVLLTLSPNNLPAHDRAAALHYRKGETDQALEILDLWRRLAPSDPLPLVRRAVLEQQAGVPTFLQTIEQALRLASGNVQASVAYLGARLALAEWHGEKLEDGVERASAYLQQCLRQKPDHVDALWTLAALRATRGDEAGLAALAPAMVRADVEEPRYHLMSAVCQLAAGDLARCVEAASRLRATPLAVEGQYVKAWALIRGGDEAGAVKALQDVANARGPSAELARGLLGSLGFRRGAFSEAVRWWSNVDPKNRAGWQLDEPLRQTVMLAGLLALKVGQFEQAADRFREAGKLGLRDRRLGSLIGLSLFKAGQRLIYQGERGG
jgi:tetratricopeptide (TPR) repeat protein